MNNEELKKKIVEVVLNSEITGIQIRAITGGVSTANSIADALIAAGIGEVKESENKATAAELVAQAAASTAIKKIAEWKHRAEVAERALYNCCFNSLFAPFGVNRPTVDELYGAHLERAEKELAEEEKDD